MARGFLMLLSATAVLSGPAVAAEGPSEPFQIEQLFGSRPVIDAMLNGRPYRMIVHANAGSYVQVNHAEARTLAVAGMVHRGDYGLEAPGQVSALGRDDGVLQSLEVAGRTRTDVPVAVFERPAGSAEGMLGLPWLTDNDVIIDYASNRITLPEDAAEAERYGQALEAQGYRPHALMRDSADGRYLIVARIDGQSMPLVVSTVAGNDLDIAAAEPDVPLSFHPAATRSPWVSYASQRGMSNRPDRAAFILRSGSACCGQTGGKSLRGEVADR